jgi:hypothetical protein
LNNFAKGLGEIFDDGAHDGFGCDTMGFIVSFLDLPTLLGDSDGLLIVALEELQAVAEKASAKRQQEIIKEDRLRSGESIKQVMGF